MEKIYEFTFSDKNTLKPLILAKNEKVYYFVVLNPSALTYTSKMLVGFKGFIWLSKQVFGINPEKKVIAYMYKHLWFVRMLTWMSAWSLGLWDFLLIHKCIVNDDQQTVVVDSEPIYRYEYVYNLKDRRWVKCIKQNTSKS